MAVETRRSSSPPPPQPPPEPEPETEAERLKTLAEAKLAASDYKSALKYARRARLLDPTLPNISNLITAVKILLCSPSDHYKILRLDPFSPPSSLRSRFKSLALSLHPDKSPLLSAAFIRVSDSYTFLSDRYNKRRFDDSLRIKIAAAADKSNPPPPPVETFWTCCDTCRLLHKFDRKYVAQRLVCPSCRKSFRAVEVEDDDENDVRVPVRVTGSRSRSRSRPRAPFDWGSGSASGSAKKKVPDPKEKTLAEILKEIVMTRKEKSLAEIQREIVMARKKKKKRKEKVERSKIVEKDVMKVEDPDFYEFDKDRSEKSFVEGQIWAAYGDGDGMPRNYGLIENVRSTNPFRVTMRWLDVEKSRDQEAECDDDDDDDGDVSCGRFRVGRKIEVDSVNCFSHLVVCERAAKEVYRVYPKKGSVWALYGERGGDEEERGYDIVVILMSYSEMYGMSMAYLEKVEGYKTVFKREKVGAHAVTWLEKVDARLFSHQIPARKLSGEEDEKLPKDCWELDPASLPSELLPTDRRRKLLA